MSGIFGLYNQDGLSVVAAELNQMASMLARRGPDGRDAWHDGPVGLGQTRLTTTPEALCEGVPLADSASGCVITADVRLDNRDDLLDALGLRERAAETGDVRLILAAYLAWGEGCVDYLLGDFAFVIWDPRSHALFCVRDRFGVRPFYYHHTADRFFAFASEPRAILVLPQTPCHINEGRIADYLITQLEGIDKTSTFFEEVYRLPPAHTLMVTPEAVRVQCYWTLEARPVLRLSSDEEYAEAFLSVFAEAVRCRLRGGNAVGSMLSGGMDSGSVTAVAKELLGERGQGPLNTFSATAPSPKNCVETWTIHAAMAMEGLDPYVVRFGHWDGLLPTLKDWGRTVDEPFDNHMTLLATLYLAARRRGTKVLLDGIDGDTVLSEGAHVARLLRQGRWWTAYRETMGQYHFWSDRYRYRVGHQLYLSARRAFFPISVRHPYHLFPSQRRRGRLTRNMNSSIINPAFADRVGLSRRLHAYENHRLSGSLPRLTQEHAIAIDHPLLTAGIERYNRVASTFGIEPRHPFLDLRMVEFCLTLPGAQRLNGGWPKIVMRRAMAGRLPDHVRWRRGKQHLGWAFTRALMETMRAEMRTTIEETVALLSTYVDADKVRTACNDFFCGDDLEQASTVYEIYHLGKWLRRHTDRPVVHRTKQTVMTDIGDMP